MDHYAGIDVSLEVSSVCVVYGIVLRSIPDRVLPRKGTGPAEPEVSYRLGLAGYPLAGVSGVVVGAFRASGMDVSIMSSMTSEFMAQMKDDSM